LTPRSGPQAGREARPRITVCGLGPGDPGHLTEVTVAAIEKAEARFVRTERHPTAGRVPAAVTFDHLYEQAGTLDEVYQGIADALVEAAYEGGDVLYAVPGSPLVLERSVRWLRADERVDVELLPAVSFLDEVWARLGVDPVDDGVRLIDGHQFAVQAAGERGPLLVAHTHAPWVLSDIKLALDAGPEQRALVLQRLGTGDERIFEVAWPDLDREVEPDHLTSLYLPELAAPVAQELARTVGLVHRLRQECPWDRAQDHQSLRKYLLEEAYEVLEVLDGLEAAPPGEVGVAYEQLEGELGDLWFQVLFHAELATEAGQFTVADVARTLHDKLVRRHPHVFGEAVVADQSDIEANWDRIKQSEHQRASAVDGIPNALPALSLADKLLERAERAGSPAGTGEPGRRLRAALPAGASEAELGRYLLVMVELARSRGLDPEAALRAAALAARDRFRRAEAAGAPSDRWLLG
jgi:tetrapyrrole methylase family protein/MazG family protein